MKFLVRSICLFFIFTLSAQAADLMYVNSKKAKLYQQANFKSDVISKLKKGDELQALQHKGKWIKVKFASLNGWVPRHSVSKTKQSKEKISFFNRLKSFFTSDSRRSRMSNVSTAGGVRGLADGETESSGNKDYESVEKMEQMGVTDEDVEKFIEGNKN